MNIHLLFLWCLCLVHLIQMSLIQTERKASRRLHFLEHIVSFFQYYFQCPFLWLICDSFQEFHWHTYLGEAPICETFLFLSRSYFWCTPISEVLLFLMRSYFFCCCSYFLGAPISPILSEAPISQTLLFPSNIGPFALSTGLWIIWLWCASFSNFPL